MPQPDELKVTITAREIYDKLNEYHSDVKHVIEDYAGLGQRVSRLEKIVYGIVPFMTIIGLLFGKFIL